VGGGQGRGIDEEGIGDGVVLNIAPLEVEQEGGLLVDGTAEIAAEILVGIVGLVGGEGIARVQCGVGFVEVDGAAVFVGAGPGEDFDAAEAEAVEFRREGILIDADLADVFLGGELAAGESVDVNLAAIRTEPGPASAWRASARSSGSSGRAMRSSPLITSAVALLSGSTLTLGPASAATLISCFSALTAI